LIASVAFGGIFSTRTTKDLAFLWRVNRFTALALRPNSGDAAFCEKWGARLEPRCPNCQAPISQGVRFCKKCGAALQVRAPALAGAVSEIRIAPETAETQTIDGERKTVTALFADIKGSMELMEDLDPEEVRAIIDPALKLQALGIR
jgi:Double zinc ribbon